MSSSLSSTLNLSLRITHIGIGCSGTKQCSQGCQIDNFCQGFFSRIQPWEKTIEIAPEQPAEMSIKLPAEIRHEILPEILFEVAVSKNDTKLPCWIHCGSSASPSPTRNLTPNLLISCRLVLCVLLANTWELTFQYFEHIMWTVSRLKTFTISMSSIMQC